MYTGCEKLTKEQLLEEVKKLQQELVVLKSRSAHFPGFSVINRYEHDLSESEEKFRSLFLHAPDIIVVVDENNKILDVNRVRRAARSPKLLFKLCQQCGNGFFLYAYQFKIFSCERKYLSVLISRVS